MELDQIVSKVVNLCDTIENTTEKAKILSNLAIAVAVSNISIDVPTSKKSSGKGKKKAEETTENKAVEQQKPAEELEDKTTEEPKETEVVKMTAEQWFNSFNDKNQKNIGWIKAMCDEKYWKKVLKEGQTGVDLITVDLINLFSEGTSKDMSFVNDDNIEKFIAFIRSFYNTKVKGAK